MNTSKPTKHDKVRLLFLGGFLVFLFAMLVTQFFKIQIVERDKWRVVAEGQHYFDVIEPFHRGTFYSNAHVKPGHPEAAQKLAVDIQKYHLYIDPEGLPEALKPEIAGKILSFLKPTQEELTHFREQFDKESRSRKLVSWIDEETKTTIQKWWRPFAKKNKIEPNTVFFVGDTLRTHPFGKLLGQVLHTVRQQKDDKTGQAFATGGLELSCNSYLKGKLGRRRMLRSPRHRLETSRIIEAPVDGADIYLTINHYLQAICEEELEKGVKTSKAKSGWAVMMNPNTGEIYALAQYPFFYPDEYQSYFNNPKQIEDTKVKAITDANEPGSIMKGVTIAIALKANKVLKAQGKPPVIIPNEKIDTSRGYFPGRSKPIRDTHFHHYLNMWHEFQKSSNIYVATIVQRIINALGAEWYRNELVNTFGFSHKTCIELPSESAGVVPTPGKKHPNGKLEWSVPTPYSLAMGHNIQVTTLQVAKTFATFANGGKRVDPILIRKIQAKDGTVLVDNTKPERVLAFPQVIDEDVVQQVVKGLKLVTKKGGSAALANIWGYTEAGKTGTASKIINGTYSESQNVCTFVGFAPVKNPAFVLAITMDDPVKVFIPGKGHNQRAGVCCGPVFKEVGRRTLEYLGVAPDDPHGYPAGDPRADLTKADMMKEVQELQVLYQKWNGAKHE